MNVWDWVAFSLYLLVTAAVGFWAARNQRTTEDYFLGAHRISWWASLLSLIATETSAVTVVAIPAMIYAPGGNLGFLQCALGFAVGKTLVALFILPYYFQGTIYTPYQVLGHYLGPYGRKAGSLLFMTALFVGAAYRIYVGSLPLHVVTGISVSHCLLVIAGITMLYTVAGGLRAVIWTDVLQAGLFLFGGIYTFVYIVNQLPNGLVSFAMQAGARAKHHLFDTGFREIEMGVWEYDWSNPHTIFAGLIGGTFIALATHGTDHSNLQRVMACQSLRTGRWVMVVSGIFVFFQFGLFLFVGAALTAFYACFPPNPDLPAKDTILPFFIMTQIPHPIAGILISAIFAAAMSSVSSALSALSASSTVDWSRKGQTETTPSSLKIARWHVLVWGLFLWVGSVVASSIGKEDLVGSIFKASSLLYGPLLGLFLIAFVFRCQPEQSGRLVVVSLSMGLAVQFLAFISGEKNVAGDSVFSLAWPWFTPLGALATFLPACLIQLFQRMMVRI